MYRAVDLSSRSHPILQWNCNLLSLLTQQMHAYYNNSYWTTGITSLSPVFHTRTVFFMSSYEDDLLFLSLVHTVDSWMSIGAVLESNYLPVNTKVPYITC